jgi:hypothetical protein
MTLYFFAAAAASALCYLVTATSSAALVFLASLSISRVACSSALCLRSLVCRFYRSLHLLPLLLYRRFLPSQLLS